MNIEHRLRLMCDALPAEAAITLPVLTVRVWLDDAGSAAPVLAPPEPGDPATWRERLWTVPAEMRLGVQEVAEAFDRSPDWVYRAVSAKLAQAKGRHPLPCSRLDGELAFTAGAVRVWWQQSEEIINPVLRTLRRAS
jgi:hypothetical protein